MHRSLSLALLFVIDCQAVQPPGHATDQTAAVVWPAPEWTAASPEIQGMSTSKLDAFRDFVGGRGCVVRDGFMVYTWGDRAIRTMVYSACKPWISHFVFKAVEEGRIPSLDQKVSVWEPRLNGINAALGYKDRDITWRHMANQISAEMIPGQRTIGRVKRPQRQTGAPGTRYSWLWWANGVRPDGKRFWPAGPLDAYAAMAGSHNVAMAIPSLDLIVVWCIDWRKDLDWNPDMNQALKLLVQSAAHAGLEPDGKRELSERATSNQPLPLEVRDERFYLDGKPFDM
ncbi:MAG: hypothetical protein HY735_14825 [Verrucomicrobia bacterium]|nr:hypothetical protein [Verrucomicrobiota bacterium]